jgi:hypothetical protein
VVRKIKDTLDVRVPLSKWNIVQGFDTAEACDKMRHAVAATLLPMLNVKSSTSAEKKKALLWMMSSACIASDDPRLKRE